MLGPYCADQLNHVTAAPSPSFLLTLIDLLIDHVSGHQTQVRTSGEETFCQLEPI